jgi:hypothetical protein
MKLLFFSSDVSEVQLASQKCADAGIACEIRSSPQLRISTPIAHCSELWIKNDADSHRALMLCVTLGVGFSRRQAVGTVVAEPVATEEGADESSEISFDA